MVRRGRSRAHTSRWRSRLRCGPFYDYGSVFEGCMTTQARHPHLLKLTDPPIMLGHRCTRCRRVAFPPDPYGCEKCGSQHDDLEEFVLEAKGTVRAVATVHRHHHASPPTPFTVAVIDLVGGPVIKAIVAGAGVSVGTEVEGVLVQDVEDAEGNILVDLQFRVMT